MPKTTLEILSDPMTRNVLPQRRYSETFELTYGEKPTRYQISIGYFELGLLAGYPAEVFITGPKAGSDVEAVARDAAVILSIALQHGVPVDVMAHSITRNNDGSPSTIMGAVLDQLAGPHFEPPRA
jgi:ribonucleoside-diphosphate reductase alpha chain